MEAGSGAEVIQLNPHGKVPEFMSQVFQSTLGLHACACNLGWVRQAELHCEDPLGNASLCSSLFLS